MSLNNQSHEQSGPSRTAQNRLDFTDPQGQYHFEVELDATSPRCPDEFPHRVYAHRRYTAVNNISPVWPTLPAVSSVLQRLIQSNVQGKDGPQASVGVTITTVFTASSGRGYVPTDILFNGHSIDDYADIDTAGLWQLPDRLVSLMESQSPRTVTSSEIPFDACTDKRVPTQLRR